MSRPDGATVSDEAVFYTVHDVVRAGHTLEPLRCLNPACPEPLSGNVTHNQHAGRYGDAYCSICGLWQIESFGDADGQPVAEPGLWCVAVYFVERCYGGPEEGGWWYDAATRCDEPAFARLGWAGSGGRSGSLQRCGGEE